MQICLLIDPSRIFRWHRWLAAELALGARHGVTIYRTDVSLPWPAGVGLAFRLDRLLQRLSGPHALDRLSDADLQVREPSDRHGDAFDILIDCAGGVAWRPQAERVLTPLFNGMPSELGALSTLLDSRDVEIGVHLSGGADGRGTIAIARPAIEHRTHLTEALDNVLSRAVELIVELVDRPGSAIGLTATASATGVIAVACGPDWSRSLTSTAFHHLSAQVAGKISRRLARTSRSGERWALALRRCPGPGLVGAAWPANASYHVFKDDGRRYFADPFVFAHGGKVYLFCEEYPFETERGLISVSEVTPDGGMSAPVQVLERPYHLSYPFVFEDAGQIWMIPEAAMSGAIELYRAVEFPHTWELERRLLDGVPGCDATLLHRGGHYWMFLTAARWQSTNWDNLRLYEAASLRGRWTAHPTGLVMIDPRLSRSAGAIVEKGGMLLRPTQDCSSIYGGGMVLSRIDRLSMTEYAQTAIAEIMPAGPSGITGTHTYSKSGNIEAVDVWGVVDGVDEVSLACRPLSAPRGAAEEGGTPVQGNRAAASGQGV